MWQSATIHHWKKALGHKSAWGRSENKTKSKAEDAHVHGHKEERDC